MPIPVTSAFEIEKIKLGNEPIFLVEIQAAGQFFSTRNPSFTGKWKAGDGLLAGAGIFANDDYPTYDGGLSQLASGGIDTISMTLDFQSGLALTGSTSVSVLNQLLFSHITDDFDLTNARMRVRLGFSGQDFSDYIVIFQGAIDQFQSTLQTMELSCVDDTLVGLKPLPPQTGSDFLPRSLTVGQAIPIVLGDVDFVPVYQTVTDVTASLFIAATDTDDFLYIAELGATFPRTGEVTVESEVITYSGVTTAIFGQQQVLVLNNLVRSAPVAHPAGASVVLTSFQYEFLLGFEPESIRRIRLPNGVAPTTTVTPLSQPLSPIGLDPRRITVLRTATEEDGLTATVAGDNRAPNLIVNGEANGAPAVGWTTGNGAWTSETHNGENAFQGRVNISQSPNSDMYQDVTTVDSARYRFTATISLDSSNAPPYATIRIGDPSDEVSVFDFGEITGSDEIGVDLTFRAPIGGTTRITLIVNSDTPAQTEDAFFDHIDLYALSSENPSSQLEFLINKHMGNQSIQVDRTSFDAAFAVYEELGDRLAGVIDVTQEAQPLLGRLAYQYRSKTFLDENGKQKLIPFSNSAPAVATITSADVDKGTFNVSFEPEEKVYTRFYVYFNRRADVNQGNLGGRESYQNILFATPEETNSLEDTALPVLCAQARDEFRINRVQEVFADMIPDAATADRLLSHITRQNTYRRLLARFTTYINRVELEIADVIRINHPLLPPSANGVTFEIIEKQIHPNGCQVSFTCAEIRQSQYGGFIENWEAPFRSTPSEILTEEWDPPGFPSLAIWDDSGALIKANPWLESWDPRVTTRDERLYYAYSSDEVGLTPVELTGSLVAAFTAEEFSTTGTGFGTVASINTIAYIYPANTPKIYPGYGERQQTTIQGDFQSSSNFANRFAEGATLPGTAQLFTVPGFDFLPSGVPALGIPEPVAAGKHPVLGVNQGPGGNTDAWKFIGNSQNAQGNIQRLNMSSCVRWLETDVTVNFWLYMTQKPSVHQPFYANKSLGVGGAFTGTEDDDRIAWQLWWDYTDDRFHMITDYFVADGAVTTPVYNDHVALLRAHANHVSHTVHGSPALNTWNMVTLRWDLSTLTMDFDINAADNVSVTLGGSPTQDSFRDMSQNYWMAEQRPQRGLVTEDDSFGMNGRLTQMHLWSRRLTDDELTELYNSGNSLPYPYI